jgi:3-phenylpropionate/trans-cinnamate dioxygenase ferredoxin reductase component
VQNILVIGGGPAGTFAAISAKQHNPASSVTLLSDEHCEPYEKPPLSKAVLLSGVLPNDALIAGSGGLAAHGVKLETRAHCMAIDRHTHSILLDDGRQLQYDALVIGTGAVANEIPQLPAGTPGVHYLRTEANARALKAALRDSKHLLIIGGGLIGLEVAASAAQLGVRTTVLEAMGRILMRVCDEETAATVHAAHVHHGVEIRVSAAVVTAKLLSGGWIVVETADGNTLTADAVVIGVGSRPNDQLAAAAGVRTSDGIIVDEYCRTSDPAILAAGDVARLPGPHGLVRLENWRHALDHGTIAGHNAAGGSETYTALPSFWSEQYDLYIQGVGWFERDATQIRRLCLEKKTLTFEICENRLCYAMGINSQRDLAVARRLIERGTLVSTAALADPTQPLAQMLAG